MSRYDELKALLGGRTMTVEERRLQRLDWAWGQLECTSNHRMGMTFEEFYRLYEPRS